MFVSYSCQTGGSTDARSAGARKHINPAGPVPVDARFGNYKLREQQPASAPSGFTPVDRRFENYTGLDTFTQHEAVILGKLPGVVARPQDQVVCFCDHNQLFVLLATGHYLVQLSQNQSCHFSKFSPPSAGGKAGEFSGMGRATCWYRRLAVCGFNRLTRPKGEECHRNASPTASG